MNAHADNASGTSRAAVHALSAKSESRVATSGLIDKRPETIAQRKLLAMISNKTQAGATAQAKTADVAPDRQPSKKTNRTGLPDQLKTGIEQLSGFSMDEVNVHYSSSAPAQLQAHAYAQGNDIYVAPGQEKHLAHEAWHVVQQKQGRVAATAQMKNVAINDDPSLEQEADSMGAKAWRAGPGAGQVSQLKKASGSFIAQLARYRSKADPGLEVDVNAGAHGVTAQAEKMGQEYKQSSLLYEVSRYMDGTNPPNTIATKVPMATQTNTMEAEPQRMGIGTLMVSEAMTYLQGRNMTYFQPDAMMTKGGAAMKDLIAGTNRSADFMQVLIAKTDNKKPPKSCWQKFADCFTCCSPSNNNEDEALLPEVNTYAAIEVDYGATASALGPKVIEKFNMI